MILAKLKAYGWAILAALGAFALVAIKYLAARLEHVKDERDRYQSAAKQGKKVSENLSEVDQTFSHRAAVRQQEKKDEPEKVPDRLRDNNDF